MLIAQVVRAQFSKPLRQRLMLKVPDNNNENAKKIYRLKGKLDNKLMTRC